MRPKNDRVILRRWRAHPRTVIACLPDAPANPGAMLMYERVGQHGEGDYRGILPRTAPVSVTEPDAAAMLRELRAIGYRPVVRRRLAAP